MTIRVLLSAITAILFLGLHQVNAEEPPTEAENQDKELLLNLIPKKTEIPDLSGRSVPEFYEPENLFDYIDGQAETYLNYGFKLLITREYATNDGLPLTLEIYQMTDPLHAFGIYAAERTPEDKPAPVGVDGYRGSNILGFWKGPYYCRILFYQTSPELESLLPKAGKLIADKIKGDYAKPEAFSVFPEDFRVKWSERFIPKDFLGQPFLKNGYRVDYDRKGRSYQAFLVQSGSRDEAKEWYRRYQEFLRSQRETVSPLKGDFEMVLVQGEKKSVLFRWESFLGGVLDEGNVREAEGVIRVMVERLRLRGR